MSDIIYLCSAVDEKGKVRALNYAYSDIQKMIYLSQWRRKGWAIESVRLDQYQKAAPHPVAYIPPPEWGGRVVCVETGWIFTSIAVAAKQMGGSHWGLRKAIVRNTIYKGYHWRMYNNVPKQGEKFT